MNSVSRNHCPTLPLAYTLFEQLLYYLRELLLGSYHAQSPNIQLFGRTTTQKGSCWLQPPQINPTTNHSNFDNAAVNHRNVGSSSMVSETLCTTSISLQSMAALEISCSGKLAENSSKDQQKPWWREKERPSFKFMLKPWDHHRKYTDITKSAH